MILSICDSASVLKVMRIIIILIKAIRIAVPIILIVTVILDYLKAVTDGDLSAPTKGVVRKLIAAVLVFLVPTFVRITIKLVDTSNEYYKCIENATSEGINNAQVSEAKQYILNAKNTLRRGNLQIAQRAVAKLDSADKQSLSAELSKVEKEVEQAEKERKAAADATASLRDSQRNSSSNNSSNNNSNNNNNNNNSSSGNPSGPSGVTANGKYTKTQIIDMTEDQVRAMSNSEFIDFIASAAQLVYREYGGVLPSVTVAQACLESGYGDHFESTSHNVFGLHGYPSEKPLVSFLRKFDNFYEGTYYHYAYFEAYSNVYGDFLAACANKNAMQAASYLSRYAGGSSTYASNIQSLITQYDLTKYDN